jgi:hypothetical protein
VDKRLVAVSFLEGYLISALERQDLAYVGRCRGFQSETFDNLTSTVIELIEETSHNEPVGRNRAVGSVLQRAFWSQKGVNLSVRQCQRLIAKYCRK